MDPEKERAKQQRYMNLELATKMTERTKNRLRNKYEQDKKRLNNYLENNGSNIN